MLPNHAREDFTKPLVLVDNTYSYDANANRIKKHTLSGLTSYHYDSLNRLIKAEYPTGAEHYSYDRAGNRTKKLWTSPDNIHKTVENCHYDSCNRLTARDITDPTGTKHHEYTYDAQGNMLSDKDNTYKYDSANRVSEVITKTGSIQKNRYDAEGLRAELEENGRLVSFIYNDEKVVTEQSDNNTIRYIRGYDLVSSDSEAAKTYYHYASDEMGSITHITDEQGNVLNHYEYDAFGNFTLKEETIENRFAFTGEQYDPVSQLYYLRARFYSPAIARFIQEDTYYGDGLNLYAYCHNNPVMYVDPSGHVCEKKTGGNKSESKLKLNLQFFASGSNATYSRYYGKTWKKVFETDSIKKIAQNHNWTLDQIVMNSSNERKQNIYDSNQCKIGEVHYGHKYRVNGKKVVGQDHYHLISDNNEIHYLLPDK